MIQSKRLKEVAFHLLAWMLLFAGVFIFIFFEQAHFDSDQAISGLMAKHLSEGRHFPVFTYGAKYVLGFETWLAAPFMYFFGATVASLKLPLLFLNFITASLLIYLLRTETKLTFFQTFLSTCFFLLPTPIAASRVIHAAVGIPTSFLACLIVWFLWESPLLLGLFLGFAISVRPFVLYAAMALALLDVLGGTFLFKEKWKRYAVSGGAMIAVYAFIQMGGHHGPNYKGPSVPAFVLKDPVSFFKTFQWLLTENLPTLFGLKSDRFLDFNITSNLTTQTLFLTPIFVLSVLVFFSRRVIGESFAQLKAAALKERFASFLMLIGFLSAWVYTAFTRGAENIMLIRYTVFCLFLPIGAAAFFYRQEKNRIWATAFSSVILLWFSLSAFNHAKLIDEYVNRQPENAYRKLVNSLETHSVHYGRADFWTAAHGTFFSQERVLLTENDFSRIEEYVPEIESHSREAVLISSAPCKETLSESFVEDRWCISRAIKSPGQK